MSGPDRAAPRYPPGTVRALLDSDDVTAPTRAALCARLEETGQGAARYFDAQTFATLRAACDRLLPQPDRAEPIDLAASIDARLAAGEGNGWRYAGVPPDGEAHRLGLRGLDERARARFGAPFAELNAADQDLVLAAVQRGALKGGAWDLVPARRFFEELLAEATETYYSHPLAQEEIGYVGMADAAGWQAIGLNELEAREPRPASPEHVPWNVPTVAAGVS